MQAAERIFLFGSHLCFGFGRLVGLPCEMQQAVDNDTVQFVEEWCAYLFGVGGNGVERDIDIAIHARTRAIIKGDDVRIIVVLQELVVHRQNLLIVAEDIVEVAYCKAILGCHCTNPTLYLRKRKRGHGNVVCVEGNHREVKTEMWKKCC